MNATQVIMFSRTVLVQAALIWLTAAAAHAEAANSGEARPEAREDYTVAIDQIIQDSARARVIFLGEPDHGDGGAMAARAELIERLYSDHGVRWVVFESSAFDARRADAAIQAGGDPIVAVQDGLLDVWSASTELDPIFQLLGETAGTDAPLRIAGMDATPIVRDKQCLHCDDLRERSDVIVDPDLRARLINAVNDIEAWKTGLDLTRRVDRPEALVENIAEVSAQLEDAGASDLGRELRGWAVWIRTITPRPPLTQDQINERDAFMAETLLAFLDRIPRDDRVVVILHNMHGARRKLPLLGDKGDALAGMPVPAGQIVAHALGEEVYSLALAAASGSVQASWNPTPRKIELPPNSFEWTALADQDAVSVFVPRDAGPQGIMPGGLVSFMRLSSQWNAMFDGVWILRETRPVRRRPDE